MEKNLLLILESDSFNIKKCESWITFENIDGEWYWDISWWKLKSAWKQHCGLNFEAKLLTRMDDWKFWEMKIMKQKISFESLYSPAEVYLAFGDRIMLHEIGTKFTIS
jgi:hypothetical protein